MTFINKNSLLTVDVDSHLQKLASNSFGSHEHYPVELVRSAIKRGATEIKILINSKKIEIIDNGKGVSQEELNILLTLLDFNLNVNQRENAIESFQTDNRIGLLAIFSPAPHTIEIENISISGFSGIRIHQGKVVPLATQSIGKGTRISLIRKKVNWQDEVIILKDYCKFIDATIIINDHSLAKKSFLANSMVTTKLRNNSAETYIWAGIPNAGDVCRIWLLDHKIPWYYATIYPWQGFIFEAAVESLDKINEHLLKDVVIGATRLYQWLADNYSSYPIKYQMRIEELLFKHFRLTNSTFFNHSFHPFKRLNPSERLSINQIRKIAFTEDLYAIPTDKDQDQYNTSQKTVLQLSQTQIDFLLNDQSIHITFLPPIAGKRNRIYTYFQSVFRKYQQIMIGIRFINRKTMDSHKLSRDEKQFLTLLNNALSQTSPQSENSKNPSAHFINIRGILPAITIEKNDGHLNKLIKRKHPLVKNAIQAVTIDPHNIELVLAIFIF